jgi:ribosome modulation factor
MTERDAFQKGFVFWETPRPEFGPPEDDTERQEWLAGFQQAYADYPDTLVRR